MMLYRIDLYQPLLFPDDDKHLPYRQLNWQPYWPLIDCIEDEEGVYIIREHVPSTKHLLVAYVGQGHIKSRVETHLREGSEVSKVVSSHYNLSATWARVKREDRNGVERYLAEKLWPIVGKEWPGDARIKVNLPESIIDSQGFSLSYQMQRWQERGSGQMLNQSVS